jgi:hypothetical protein
VRPVAAEKNAAPSLPADKIHECFLKQNLRVGYLSLYCKLHDDTHCLLQYAIGAIVAYSGLFPTKTARACIPQIYFN